MAFYTFNSCLKTCLYLLFCLLLFAACAEKEREFTVYYLTGIDEIQPAEIDGTALPYADTLRNHVGFLIYPQSEYFVTTESEIMMPVRESYIFPPFQNPTVSRHSVLIFDKPIVYKDQIIEAGSNLLDHPDLARHYGEIPGYFIPGEFYFGYELMPTDINFVALSAEAFRFEPGDYEVVLQWGTAEDEIFRETINVYIDPCTENCPGFLFTSLSKFF